MSIEAMKLALEALEAVSMEMTVGERYTNAGQLVLDALELLRVATTQQPAAGEPVTGLVRLPDGSAFAIASFPLPKDHWLYAPREYATGAGEPLELPAPILTHGQREAVVAAIRYAVRGATMCGREQDFDPDALVQNAVYALCGPYASGKEGGET